MSKLNAPVLRSVVTGLAVFFATLAPAARAQAPLGLTAAVDDVVDPIVLPASEAEFVVEVVNFSAATVADVVVRTTTPTGTFFGEASTSVGDVEAPQQGQTGPMTVRVGSLESGARAQIRFELGLEPGAGPRLDFEASVTSAAGDVASLRESTFIVSPGDAVLRWDPLSFRSGPPSASTPLSTVRIERPVAPLFRQNDFPIPIVPAGVSYRVYRDDVPSVAPTPANLVLEVPGTQRNTGALVEPGFYVVTVVVDGVESGVSNAVSLGKGEPRIDRVTIKQGVLTARGESFDATAIVAMDGVGFVRPATVKRGGTKLVQTGKLATGESLGRYVRAHPGILVCFTNANGSIACVPYGLIPSSRGASLNRP